MFYYITNKRCARRPFEAFDFHLASTTKETQPKLYSDLKRYLRFATPKTCDAFAIFGEYAATVAADIAAALFLQPGNAVHVDILDVIRTVENVKDLSVGRQILSDAVIHAEKTCGANALVIIHHAEAMKGKNVQIFDAYLDLFNGENGLLLCDGKFIRPFGALFLMLFESDELARDGQDWISSLRTLWAFNGLAFTTDAAVGRVRFGTVLNPCPNPGTCLVTDWKRLFPNSPGHQYNEFAASITTVAVIATSFLVLLYYTWKKNLTIKPGSAVVERLESTKSCGDSLDSQKIIPSSKTLVHGEVIVPISTCNIEPEPKCTIENSLPESISIETTLYVKKSRVTESNGNSLDCNSVNIEMNDVENDEVKSPVSTWSKDMAGSLSRTEPSKSKYKKNNFFPQQNTMEDTSDDGFESCVSDDQILLASQESYKEVGKTC